MDDWILPELMGDFEDWNDLAQRGHEIMPHSWQHLNLAKQSHEKSVALIEKCLDYFETNLDGYLSKMQSLIFHSMRPHQSWSLSIEKSESRKIMG